RAGWQASARSAPDNILGSEQFVDIGELPVAQDLFEVPPDEGFVLFGGHARPPLNPYPTTLRLPAHDGEAGQRREVGSCPMARSIAALQVSPSVAVIAPASTARSTCVRIMPGVPHRSSVAVQTDGVTAT